MGLSRYCNIASIARATLIMVAYNGTFERKNHPAPGISACTAKDIIERYLDGEEKMAFEVQGHCRH